MKMRSFASIGMIMVLAGSATATDIAWDTLGPSNMYDPTTGGIVRGPLHANGAWWTGVQFTAQASGEITELDVAIVHNGGDNLYRAELWSDANNEMGSMLSDFGTFVGHSSGEPPTNITGNNFLIESGTTYWMVLKGEGSATGAWRRSLLSDPGWRSFSRDQGGSWSYFTSDPRYAFRIRVSGEPPCYANCDGSTTEPILTVDDFTCFINEFAAAQSLPPQQQIEHYANCDGSTTEPILTVDDFTCFINAFAQGCP